MTTTSISNSHLSKVLDNLTKGSTKNYYNPYQEFTWTDTIPENQYWMSPELLSVYGTPYMNDLSDGALMELSKWECVNFFSINVHGERGLLQSVLNCIHQQGFDEVSEYLHHFVGEENEHMWFFSQFCLRYGGKIYKDKGLKHTPSKERKIEQFLSFARILIFEEIGDFYNVRMRDDERLPPIIRQISRVHHQDESRHLAMGREVVKKLYQQLQEKYPPEDLRELAGYLQGYMQASLALLYNPIVYRDAGLESPYEVQRNLLADENRQNFHQLVLKRVVKFFNESGIFRME